MKKIFIVFIVIFILLFIGGIGGYFYYDKYIRHGEPANIKDSPINDGFYFENAVSEKTLIFWNFNGNFHVVSDSFSSTQEAKVSFESKRKTYEEIAELNNMIISYLKIYWKEAFILKDKDTGRATIHVQNKNKNMQFFATDRPEEEVKKFVKWYFLYWDKY